MRNVIARSFSWVEDIMYVALGVLLAASAVVLLGSTAFSFARQLFNGTLPGSIVEVLDRLLLVLMIVELLYTVQVSFREHALVPEPFLIVGLVAATRRILVLTAEFSRIPTSDVSVFRSSMIELGLLTLMIVAFVGSLLMLRSRHPEAVATRA